MCDEKCIKEITVGGSAKILVCSQVLTNCSEFWEVFFGKKFNEELKISEVDEHDVTEFFEVLSKRRPVTEYNVDTMLYLSDMWLTKIVQFRCCIFMINFASHRPKSPKLFVLLTMCYNYGLRKCVLARLFSDCAKFPFGAIEKNKDNLTLKLYEALFKAKCDFIKENQHTNMLWYDERRAYYQCRMCGKRLLAAEGEFFECLCCSGFFRRYALTIDAE